MGLYFSEKVNYINLKRKLTKMPNDKISAVGVNLAEKKTVIWNVADLSCGSFKPHEYGHVILPMTVVESYLVN